MAFVTALSPAAGWFSGTGIELNPGKDREKGHNLP
jgi:hypothetical protein